MNGDLIVGFDGSDPGRDGLALGRRMAFATGARATVVYDRSYIALTEDARESGEDLPWAEAADRVLDEAREMLADVPEVSFRAVAERSAAARCAPPPKWPTPGSWYSARRPGPASVAWRPGRRPTRSCRRRHALPP